METLKLKKRKYTERVFFRKSYGKPFFFYLKKSNYEKHDLFSNRESSNEYMYIHFILYHL